jgi:hypothetical protein
MSQLPSYNKKTAALPFTLVFGVRGHLATTVIIVILWLVPNYAVGYQSNQRSGSSEQSNNWRSERASLEFQFGENLVKIADWCRKENLQNQVPITFALKTNRDPRRQYIFLPSSKSNATAPKGIDKDLVKWLEKINATKVEHSKRIFKLAEKCIAADAPATAYQLLHEVLHYDRDNAEVRAMLGHKKKDDGWHVISDSFRWRTSKIDHPTLPLEKGQYYKAVTPHFEIDSTADETRTRYLANQLERAHAVWRQVFFDYWGSKKKLKECMAGKTKFRTPSRKFKVVFFRNKLEYANVMAPLVRGIEKSSGYYSIKRRMSFFYDGDTLAEKTWRHELTHQLFRESRGRVPENAFQNSYIWLDEGVASYFESLADHDGYITLGGFDARRTQYARIQSVIQDDLASIASLNAISQDQWQLRADANLYSQSAAIVDMLLNDELGKHEQDFVSLMQVIYKGRPKPGLFKKILGQPTTYFDSRFKEYLKVTSAMVSDHLSNPASHEFLSLPNAKLDTTAFDSIGRCVNLKILDLSGNQISADNVQRLKRCTKLQRLILTRCSFDPKSIAALLAFPVLNDIDLSGCQLVPQHFAELKLLSGITDLSLIASNISDADLIALAAMPNLRRIDISQTNVSAAAVNQLQSVKPGIVVTRHPR